MTDETALRFEPYKTYTLAIERAEVPAEDNSVHEHYRILIAREGIKPVTRSAPNEVGVLHEALRVLIEPQETI